MTTWTIDASLAKPAYGDLQWHVPLWATADNLEWNVILKGLEVGLPLAERAPTDGSPPVSTSLNLRLAGGSFWTARGLRIDVAPATVTLPASGTSQIFRLEDGTPGVAPGLPTGNVLWLAEATADATHVTALADRRWCLRAAGADLGTAFLARTGGSFDDAAAVVTVATGSTNGTVFGAAGDKLAFFAGAPVGKQAAITANNATAFNTGDAPTDTALNALRQRVIDLENRIKAFNLMS